MLQLGGGGDGDTPEVPSQTSWSGFLRSSVNLAALAHLATHEGAAHNTTQGVLVGLREVAVPGDVYTDIRLR